MIVNYLLVVILLILFAGIGIDAGLLEYYKSQLSFCAKASAVSMTMAIQRGFSNTDVLAAGQATAQLNGFKSGINGVTITYETPPSTGAYSGVVGAARVLVSKAAHNSFMTIIGAGSSGVSAEFTQPAATVVNMSSKYNRWGIWTDYTHIQHGGLDNYSSNNAAFSANVLSPVRTQNNLGPLISWRGFLFFLGLPNVADAVAQTPIPLPAGKYSQLLILTGTAIGSTTGVVFTVTYSDGSTVSQSFDTKDWCQDQFSGNGGSDPVAGPPYRLMNVRDDSSGPSYQQYILNYMTGHSVALDRTKTVAQVTLPTHTGPEVIVMAMDLIR